MMFNTDDGYSTFVFWVKVILPIAAMFLLSTLFLFSGQVDVTKSIPYTKMNVDEIIRNQRISAPYFSSVTENGTKIRLSAAFATPDTDVPDKLLLDTLNAQLDLPTRNHIDLSANSGVIQSSTQSASLFGNVQLTDSHGNSLTTEGLILNLDSAQATSLGEITAEGPIGIIQAGGFKLHKVGEGHQLVLLNGVTVVYQPTK